MGKRRIAVLQKVILLVNQSIWFASFSICVSLLLGALGYYVIYDFHRHLFFLCVMTMRGSSERGGSRPPLL